MGDPGDKAARFLALHIPGTPLVMPNPWDVGSAKLLESLGFQALATTSSGFAATLGRLDGFATCDEVLAHAAAMVEATDVPVSADFEQAFADDVDGVARNVSLAKETGLAGCSVEDYAGRTEDTIYDTRARDRAGCGGGGGGARRAGAIRDHHPRRELTASRSTTPSNLPGRARRAFAPSCPASTTSAG